VVSPFSEEQSLLDLYCPHSIVGKYFRKKEEEE
jgi:hypothetical protein